MLPEAAAPAVLDNAIVIGAGGENRRVGLRKLPFQIRWRRFAVKGRRQTENKNNDIDAETQNQAYITALPRQL